jgi:hypothetical protein
MLWAVILAAAPAALNGGWVVDLRPTPESPAYTQPMTLAVAADGSVSGTFYGAPVISGRASESNGRTCLAFTTSDGSGAYQHSGCLRGDAVEGLSWSTGRGFLLAWRATRAPAADARP